MANMIKFYRGLVNSLPTAGENGALYITTDEGAIYYGTGTGMKRLGDFVQVDNVAALPEKAHESCLYYCVAENILAKWNGTEWKQINKQPTAEEMKTLLGLGSMAYKSEVAEGDLNTDLAAKINAASGAQHTHANKALLDTYTQTEADLADAVTKKHAHANAEELAKIVDGDKAKWDAVVADHLTSADKTTLENAIKEAKKAGTDANTALETYKVTNDARVLAVEEDVAEITDGTNGILAQAKTYSDGKIATARTEITAEIDADVKVVNDAFEAYKTSNDSALAGVKATADAAAVKTEVEAELAKKVEKVEGKDLIATSEIERLAGVHNYDDTALAGRVTTAEGKITALETASATHATKGEVEAVDAKFANYKTAEAQKEIDDAQDARIKAIEDDYVVANDIANFETKENVKKVADDLAAYVESNDAAVADRYTKEEADGKFALIADAYNDEEVRGLISDNADAIATEKERAEGIEAGLRTDVDAIKGDYLKAEDKAALQDQITANANAIELLTNGVSAEEVDGVNDLIQYVKDHGTEVTGMKGDISANAKAIEDEASRADTAEKALAGRLDVLEAIDHEAYVAADTALKTELQAEIDADVKALADGAVATNAANIAANAKAITDGDAATLASAKEEAQSKVDALANGAVATNTASITANAEAIATKANATDVYAKTETFTKDEVNAAIAAAVEAAHTWGEF